MVVRLSWYTVWVVFVVFVLLVYICVYFGSDIMMKFHLLFGQQVLKSVYTPHETKCPSVYKMFFFVNASNINKLERQQNIA